MKQKRYAVYAWGVLAINLLVVLWGAYVRASGSGAGCGRHWPLCNGVVLPREPRIETIIEFTHRASSGIALIAVVGLILGAFLWFPPRHRVRRGATAAMGFIIIEALLGAGLVLFHLVEDDASMARAFSMIAHLINTFLLIAAITLTAWWASGAPPSRVRHGGPIRWLLAAGLAAVLLLGATGAIAALGDTLFPSLTLRQGFQADFSPTAHFLLRLRVLHPLIAVATGVYLLFVARLVARARPGIAVHRLAIALSILVILQLLAGALNLALLAPISMQLIHLALADLVWIALVLLSAAALAPLHAPAPRTLTDLALEIS